jgi:hypothetical protein
MMRSMRSLWLWCCLGLSTAVVSRAQAACEDGIRLFPSPGATVPTNVQFVLEGVLAEQDRVSKLIGSSSLALLGGGDPVTMTVETGWSSAMNRVAVKLKPTRPLLPNTEYTLNIGQVLTMVKLLNGTTARWTTGPSADTVAPKFVTKPAVSEGFYQRTRDGLTRTLKLRTQVNDIGSTYLLVTIQRARGVTTKQQYPVPLDSDAIVFGHDVCSGSFGFDDGRAYRVMAELFDAAGNRAPKPFNLELSAPRQTGPEPANQ